ncbi:MAG: RNA polymerase factor sigma-54 [Candidatus Margulisbacteria bacterium]|nr:RNA polymerase factor sigma-54 [Candidatus Margulisiibacteriota bacterium]
MPDLGLQPELRQTLELQLAPRLIQMLKILNLSYADLVERINKEAEENVVLEVERQDQYLELIRYLNSDKKIKKEADFSEMPGLENVKKVAESLEEHLLHQLELENLDPAPKNIGQKIIGNIDDFGFVVNYPALREKIMAEFSVSRPTVDKVLKIIQGFEPEGVGARDAKECLLIQIGAYSFENEELQDILYQAVEKYLPAIAEGNLTQLAAGLKVSQSAATEIINFIKNNLNPNPGQAFGGETKFIIPSFSVEKSGAGYQVINLETRYGPTLNLSRQYQKMLENPKTDEKTRTFLLEKLKRAKDLMEDFAKRTETLEKIVRKIIETQEAFFDKGIVFLTPLSQKSLAQEYGLHPSTISRTVAEKYIQTEKGAFPLKFLCPRGTKGFTVPRLKDMVSEIIKGEDKNNPLSDGEITEKMHALGAKIDRRTTAYYRKELKIPSADDRAIK